MLGKHMASALVALAAMGTLSPRAEAAETVNLRFASVFPATHWTWVRGGEVFANAVKELTGGKVTFTLYPAGQLGKEGGKLLGSGLAETAILVPSYEPAKLPLTSVSELPGLYATSCEGTAKLWNILKDGGALYEAEYKPQGLVPLYVNVLPPFHLVSSTKQITKLEDVAGLKLRANGTAMTMMAKALDAVPITVATTEFYDSLSRGTVDGGVYYMGSVKQTGLDDVVRYSFSGTQLGGGATVVAISRKTWDSFDAATQKALRAAGEKTQAQLCTDLEKLDGTVVGELVAAKKLTVTEASAEERGRWAKKLSMVSDYWAKQLDDTRRPGTKMLEAFRSAGAHF